MNESKFFVFSLVHLESNFHQSAFWEGELYRGVVLEGLGQGGMGAREAGAGKSLPRNSMESIAWLLESKNICL